MQHPRSFRASLLATGAVLSFAGAAQAQVGAYAADQASAPSSQVDQVVVTGARASQTIDQKRQAVGVVDGISAAEIQKLPNTTVAETLVHVTGVSVTPNNDNERGRNMAEDPAIRGLDSRYNNVSIDGLPVAMTNFTGTGVSSRTVSLDILPATMVRDIQVFKTYSPDQDPQSIGGGIELATRSAFDNGGAPMLQVIAKSGFNSLHSQPVDQSPVNYGGDIVASRTFGSSNQFGFVLSMTYEHSEDYTYDNATTDSGFYNFYNNAGQLVSNPAQSNGFAVPQQSKAWVIEETNDKADITGKFEYRPNDRLRAFVEGGYYYYANDGTRNEIILTPGGTLTNQTATTGTYSQGDVEVGGQYSPLHRSNYDILGGATYSFTDRDSLSVRAGDSFSNWFQPQQMVKFINQTTSVPTGGSSVATSPMNGFNYVLSDNFSNFNMNPAVFANPANWGGFYWRLRDRTISTANDTFKVDFAHNADRDASGFGFKLGGDFRQTRNDLRFRSPEFDPAATGAVNLSVAQQQNSMTIPNYSNLPFLMVNVPAGMAYLQAHPNLFVDTNQNAANNGSNFDLRETIADGYGMLVYNSSRLHAFAGLRSDSAGVDVTGEQQLPNPKGAVQTGLSTSPYPAYAPIRVTSHYTNILPAAAISYQPWAALELHAAVSKTVGRPDFGDYSPSSAVSQDPGTGIVSISQGNPNLKPRVSTNYDLAAEWYFERYSMLSIAPFYKQISNEIFSITTNGSTVFNGVTAPSVTTQPVNAASSNLKGFEAELVHSDYGELTPWLEGVGTTLNFTALAGHAVVPSPTGASRTVAGLINQPQYVGNAILSYQLQKFTGAMAFNFTGKSLRQLNSSASWQDVYWEPHQQLDLKVGYALRHDLDITAAVQNLTDATTKSVTGPGKNLLKDISYVGQTVWFGVVFRPGW